MHSSNFINVVVFRGGMSLKETKAVMTGVGQNPHPPVCVSDEKRTRASYSNTALPTQQKTTPQKARANGKRRAILVFAGQRSCYGGASPLLQLQSGYGYSRFWCLKHENIPYLGPRGRSNRHASSTVPVH